jgi:hypothetical protein
VIDRYKRLIMECVPGEPSGQTDYEALCYDVHSYCRDLGMLFDAVAFDIAISELDHEQCIVYFSRSDVRTTYHGLIKFA